MIHVTSDEQFKTAIAAADKFTVASFSAPWCGSCKMIKPKVEKLGEDLADKSSFLKLDAEELEEFFRGARGRELPALPRLQERRAAWRVHGRQV
ncbi:hypothetical protein PINS_up022784 [Pythium insidiosum]|nr:hypothetical protein PINS_up022784 [Pythium insidiosum]